jgi:hypothetical protein
MKYFVLSLIFLIGCADPTYLPSDSNSGQNQQQEASCSVAFKNSGNCIDWKWEKMPTESEMGAFYFKTYRKNTVDGSAILLDQASVPQIVLWMPSMNHGSSPVSTGQEDTGTYRATNVFFIMPGEWEIKFQIKDGNQVIDEAIVTLTI